MPTTIGTTQSTLTNQTPKTATSDLSEPGDYGYAAFPPANDFPASGAQNRRYVIESIEESNTFAIVFHGTGAADEEAIARVWGCTQVGESGSVVYFYLGTLNLKLGTADAYDSDFFIDDIAVDDDATDTPPGMRIIGDAANAVAMLVFDSSGFSGIVIEVTRQAFGEGDPMDSIGIATRAY